MTWVTRDDTSSNDNAARMVPGMDGRRCDGLDGGCDGHFLLSLSWEFTRGVRNDTNRPGCRVLSCMLENGSWIRVDTKGA
jgi:hypothetical protein